MEHTDDCIIQRISGMGDPDCNACKVEREKLMDDEAHYFRSKSTSEWS